MIQRLVIEEFLEELLEKLPVDDYFWEEYSKDSELVRFVQDWLQEHKGEM